MTSGIDTIIFDLDGTLIDSVGHCTAILNEMLFERGCERQICVHAARPWLTVGGRQMVTALLANDCGDPDQETADFRRRYQGRPTPVDCLYEGVAEGLEQLRERGYRIALCSNKPQLLCEKVLTELGLAQCFDLIVGSRPELRPKPAPDMLAMVLVELGVTADNCVLVGDSEIDQIMADEAGMPFLFMTYGYAAANFNRSKLTCLDGFEELVAYFGGVSARIARTG